MNVFARKATALKYLKDNMILCNDNITKYFILKQWIDFKDIIEKKQNPNYYEYINDRYPFNFFMDIEIYKDKALDEYNNHETIIKSICAEIEFFVNSLYKESSIKTVILESHLENVKRSYHIIFRIWTGNKSVYFKNIRGFKRIVSNLFTELVEKK